MTLFHFSDDPDIEIFTPRPVRIPVERPGGQDWLNGPLVWAIDAWHEPLYLFPRECPRILLWPTQETTKEDRAAWFGDSAARMIAFVERAWLERLVSHTVYRYAFDPARFEGVADAGMWVSRFPETPLRIDALSDLPEQLAARGVDLRVEDSLVPLKGLWQTSLHASGIRLRNAAGWGAPGWPHSRTKT
jgi:hypothetical protein